MSGQTTNSLSTPHLDLIYQYRIALIDLEAAQAERDDFRLLSQEALHKIAAMQIVIDRLNERNRQVVAEFRAFRAAMIRTPEKVT